MIDHFRTQVSKTLEREANTLANVATATLAQRWISHAVAPTSSFPAPTSGLSEGNSPSWNRDELNSILRDGFVWLGSVIGLSIVVDEPGLIADDVRWLTRMFGARQISINSEAWVEELLHSYATACETTLPAEMCAPVHESIKDALQLLGNHSPS